MKLRRATQSVNDLSGARSFGGFFSSISVQLVSLFFSRLISLISSWDTHCLLG